MIGQFTLPSKRLFCPTNLLLTLALVSLAACDGAAESTSGGAGGGGSGGAGAGTGTGGVASGPPVLEVVYGSPAPPEEPPTSDVHAVSGYVTAAGDSGALVVIGTTTGAYQASPQGIAELAITGDEPDLPASTGVVRAIAPYEDGVLVAADSALFFTKGSVLQLSLASEALHPLGITTMSARIADDDGDGQDAAYLTLLTPGGAYELAGGSLVEWTVEGEASAPVAAFAQKERVILSFVGPGGRTYEIDKASSLAYPLVFDIGRVSAIACDSLACDDGSLLYFATDKGLVERGSDGGYTLYPLAPEGQPAVPVETFAFDAGRQRLYALAGGQVLRVHAGEVPEAVALSEPGDFPREMAFDKLGDLWLGDGGEVHRIALGTPLSFDTDVKPIMHEYCADCHKTGIKGAPVRDFEEYTAMVELTDKVLMRIADGSMPPPGAGYPKVPKEKYQLLLDWSAEKAP